MLRNELEEDMKGLRIYSLELNPTFASISTQLISLAGLSNIIKVIIGPSSLSLPHLLNSGELKTSEVDFLFLDHDPPAEVYVKDFLVVEKLGLLRKGALVVADNVVRPGASEYRELMREREGWESWGVRGLIWPGEIEVSFSFVSVLVRLKTNFEIG